MKHKTNILVIIIGVLLCFVSCKKYPEDKFISLNQPEKRVIGDWKIVSYDFDNNGIIDQLNAKLKTFDIRDLTLRVVGQDGKNEGYYCFSPYFNTGFQDFPIDKSERALFHFKYHDSGQVDFGDSLQKLVFLTPLSLKGTNYTKWDIRNLYENKMHLQLKTDSGNYDIYFEK